MLDRKGEFSDLKDKSTQIAPPGEYMCEAQLIFFRDRLENEKRALLENAQNTLDSMQSIEPDTDHNDRASVEEKYLLEFKVRDRERKLLKKIEDSLIRIDKGTYGWCQVTGEPIGIPRLLVRPTAALCIEAQKRHELSNRFYGR